MPSSDEVNVVVIAAGAEVEVAGRLAVVVDDGLPGLES